VLQRQRAGVRASVKPALSLAAVAGIAGLGFTPAHAADAADAAVEVTAVEVTAPMRAEPDSPKYTAPLVETPQTITVVPREVIEAQNLMSLRDVLSTLPGITFGAGEGGGGYGDSINLRGYSASSDLTVDGVRDSAQYTRSDPFNLEQIEVVNGANSAYAGAGSAGGSINMVSKGPRGRDAAEISIGGGSDG
jgi:catecholate siderophore receptor